MSGGTCKEITREYIFPHSLLNTVFSPLLQDNMDALMQRELGGDYALFYSGRNGIYHILAYLKKRYGASRIFIPEGICKIVPQISGKARYEIIYYTGTPKGLRRNDVFLVTDSALHVPNGAFSIQDNAQQVIPPSKRFDFTVYSFGQNKPLSCAGGGAVVVNNKKFLPFLKISDSLNQPGFGEEARCYISMLKWKIRAYKIVRIFGRMALKAIRGKNWKEGLTGPSGHYELEHIDYTIPKLSRRLASDLQARLKSMGR